MKHLKNFRSINESVSGQNVKKGDMVPVTLNMYKGTPTYKVEAYNDSYINNGQESFTFLQGGDMMMIANWDGKNWVCN